MDSLFDLFVTIGIKDEASEGIKKVAGAANDAADDIAGSGDDMADSLAGLTNAIVGAFTVKKIVEFGAQCIETAAEVQASVAQFEQTFTTGGQNLTKSAQKVLDKVASDTGIFANRLRDSGTKIYAFATSSGASSAEALSLMEEALTVAADSAAYYDTTVEQATETLQSFLKGNYANDAALGVSATETTRNAAAMELFGEKFQNLTEIQKQQTLLKMVKDSQTLSGAVGQAARESDSWANATGNLSAKWQEFMANLGTPLLEGATDVVVFLTDNFDSLVPAVEAAATVIGVSLAAKALPAAITAVTTFTAALATNPIFLAAAAIGGLTYAIADMVAAQEEKTAALEESAEAWADEIDSSEEAAAKLAELTAQLAAMDEEYANSEELRLHTTDEWAEAYDELEIKISALKDRYAELRAEEEAAADPINVFSQATEQYVTDATALYEQFQATYENVYSIVASWFAPFEKATASAKKNSEDMLAAMQSQVDFYNSYSQSLQTLSEYGLGGLADSFQDTGAEGKAYADAIIEAVEEAGGATSEEGQKIIQQYKDISTELESSRASCSASLMLMSGDFEEELDKMTEALANSVEGMDKSTEANQAAIDTLQGYLEGLDSETPGILAAYEALGRNIVASMQRGIGGGVTVPQEVGSTIMSRNAIGLDYVPYNEYVASLHRGEAVLTAVEADRWRRGLDRDGNVIQTASDQQPIVTVANSSDDRVIGLLEQVLDSIGDNLQGAIASGNKGMSNRDFARAVRGVT